VAQRPFADADALFSAAETVWSSLSPDDWREAFRHHPRIGDKEALRERFQATRDWAASEQAGALGASESVLDALAAGNRDYEERFGYIFIVCATGKSADEMLALLRSRLAHAAEDEIRVAAAEQARITRLRLEKLLAT
jgi:2-oxo-4-hydroxy-4-carboxy-5-ureidoimidazoline decarboxylase